jgi:hypothetical protein
MLLQTNSETHENVFCLEIVWGSPWQASLSLDVNSGPIFQSPVDIACPKDLFIRSNEKKLPQSLIQISYMSWPICQKNPKKYLKFFP